jgi:hypothetical protein
MDSEGEDEEIFVPPSRVKEEPEEVKEERDGSPSTLKSEDEDDDEDEQPPSKNRKRRRVHNVNKPAHKAHSNSVKLINDHQNIEVAARKQSHAADFTIAELVGTLDAAIDQIADGNDLKPYIVKVRNKAVSSHNASRASSDNKEARDEIFAMSEKISEDITAYADGVEKRKGGCRAEEGEEAKLKRLGPTYR